MEKMNEEALDALNRLGFIPEEIEGFGYRFEFEGKTFVFTPIDEAKCVTIIVPDLFDITNDNRVRTMEAMLDLCGKVKYVQTFIMFENQVWINYQHFLGEASPTPELIEHMVRVLAYAVSSFHKTVHNIE